jgi:hypothetical protein
MMTTMMMHFDFLWNVEMEQQCCRHGAVTFYSTRVLPTEIQTTNQFQMSSVIDTANVCTEEVGVGNLPMRKRKDVEGKADENPKRLKRGVLSGPRVIRLEQNRKAARESRRRKKVMIEELQRSVIFFSRTNGTLKQQNEELTRLLMQAQAQVGVIENQKKGQSTNPAAQAAKSPVKTKGEQKESIQQSQAETVASQAIYESQGFPSAAARAAAHSMNATSTATPEVAASSASSPRSSIQSVPHMQPGATMQAMASFQQAAAAAMQSAAQGMQGNVGHSIGPLAPPPPGPHAQQVFNDTMAAIAMQQAAAAAVTGQQFLNNPFMAPMLAWQNHQASMVSAAAPGAPVQKPSQGLNCSPSQISSVVPKSQI